MLACLKNRSFRIILYNSIQSRSLYNGKRVVLGIESSCDDSCAAIVTEEGTVLSSVQQAQHAINRQFRGVVPSIASKSHEINVPIVINKCIENCGGYSFIDNIDAVALTIGPGLAPCLNVGLKCAKEFCKKYAKPLVLVNHMEAHAMAATMSHQVFYPSFGFMVSGGNTEIVYIPDHLHHFLKVGDTVDDACGECMDKVYRCIIESLYPELPRSVVVDDINTIDIHSIQQSSKTIQNSSLKHGGAQISIWSKEYEQSAEFASGGKRIPFPLPMSRQRNANFSFSGIKTFSVRTIEKMKQSGEISQNDLLPVQRFCYYFEHTLIKHLIKKLEFALDWFPEVQSICCGGGVMSNQLLQQSLRDLGERREIDVFIPPRQECTDNAIMIAWRGLQLLKAGRNVVFNDFENIRYNDRLDFPPFPY